MKSVSPQPFSCLDDASELCCREWMSEECVVQKCKTSSLFTQSSSLQEGARIVINAPMRTPKCNQQNLLEPKEGWRKLNKNSLSQGCHFTQIWKGGKKGRKVYDCTETARKGPCKMVAGSLSKCVCNPERANKHARTHARTHTHTHTTLSLSEASTPNVCKIGCLKEGLYEVAENKVDRQGRQRWSMRTQFLLLLNLQTIYAHTKTLCWLLEFQKLRNHHDAPKPHESMNPNREKRWWWPTII
jgi:hypothetical protein